MELNHLGSPVTKKLIFDGKGDANHFWGLKRTYTGRLTGRERSMINTARYNALMANNLKPVIRIEAYCQKSFAVV